MPERARFARSVAHGEVALPRRPGLPQLQLRAWLARLAPMRPSLLIAVALIACAAGAYLVARETPLFSIDRIDVEGGSPGVERQVREALGSFLGKPLVGLDGSAVLGRVDALPTVVRASYDRAFPHTLRVRVVPERPAAVLRRGAASWLVSARGRVIERLSPRSVPRLPRIWLSTRTSVRTGEQITASGSGAAARAVGLAGALAARIASAAYRNGTLVLRLRSGLELLLGSGSDVRLKLAVAARALTALPLGSTFLDVSIPGRPVSGTVRPTESSTRTSSRG